MTFAKTLGLLTELGVFYDVDSEFQIKLWGHGSKTREKNDLLLWGCLKRGYFVEKYLKVPPECILSF